MSDASAQPDATSMHVRRAKDGDLESLQWIVVRFTPLLMAQAAYRLRGRLAETCDAGDLVQDVWVRALPKLGQLGLAHERATPVLVSYLGSVLLHRVNDLLDKHFFHKPGRLARRSTPESIDPVEALSDKETSVVTRVVTDELQGRLTRALCDLDPRDRELIVLRGIEQNSVATVGKLLGLRANTVSVLYRRAVDRLRAVLPGSVFDELP